MSDMADFARDCFVSRTGNPNKGDPAFFGGKRKYVNTISNITCKHCKKTGLYWNTVNGQYRLHDRGTVHTCY